MVHFDLLPARPPLDEVEDLAHHMHTLHVDDAGYTGYYTCLVCLASVAAQLWDPPLCMQTTPSAPQAPATHSSTMPCLSLLTCFMCGGPHHIFDYPVAHAYHPGWLHYLEWLFSDLSRPYMH